MITRRPVWIAAAVLAAAVTAVQGVSTQCPPGMHITVSTRKPTTWGAATAPQPPVEEEVAVRPGQKLKAYVTVANANASETILDADVGLLLRDSVSYAQAVARSDKALPLPLVHDSVVMWRGLGPLTGASFGVLLQLGECLPETAEVPVSAVVMLGDNRTACELFGSRLILRRKPPRTANKARCTTAPAVDKLGSLCSGTGACGQGLVCRHGRCSRPLTAVNDPCTSDSTCGSGNNCIDGFCQYCARYNQGCRPPDICPGELQSCRQMIGDPDAKVGCGWTWSFTYAVICSKGRYERV